mmetsp:Transcript_86434/g.241853  ORF Transcript_86434/g.241853 Transcript_86434/m.241853 type:complete len:398 (-) Transcript_86434:245-1438(-)
MKRPSVKPSAPAAPTVEGWVVRNGTRGRNLRPLRRQPPWCPDRWRPRDGTMQRQRRRRSHRRSWRRHRGRCALDARRLWQRRHRKNGTMGHLAFRRLGADVRWKYPRADCRPTPVDERHRHSGRRRQQRVCRVQKLAAPWHMCVVTRRYAMAQRCRFFITRHGRRRRWRQLVPNVIVRAQQRIPRVVSDRTGRPQQIRRGSRRRGRWARLCRWALHPRGTWLRCSEWRRRRGLRLCAAAACAAFASPLLRRLLPCRFLRRLHVATSPQKIWGVWRLLQTTPLGLDTLLPGLSVGSHPRICIQRGAEGAFGHVFKYLSALLPSCAVLPPEFSSLQEIILAQEMRRKPVGCTTRRMRTPKEAAPLRTKAIGGFFLFLLGLVQLLLLLLELSRAKPLRPT